MMATLDRIPRYALAQYVPKCDQETIAATKVNDTGFRRRATSPPDSDLYAVSIARGTTNQNQRRVQGQPATGIEHCRTPNETTIGGHRSSNPETDWQHAPFVT